MAQLQLYLKSTQAGVTPAAAAQRKVLMDIVLENPTSPEAWCRFLESEEAISGQAAPLDAAIKQQLAARNISLYHLFHKATELVQRGKGKASEAYVKIWLGYARHQW